MCICMVATESVTAKEWMSIPLFFMDSMMTTSCSELTGEMVTSIDFSPYLRLMMCMVSRQIIASRVAATATMYIPAPHARPIAAATQSPAAVVTPRTTFFWKMITPAPMKPMPDTTWAATRAASKRPVKAYWEINMNNALPRATRKWVRRPASLALNSRSKPMRPPSSPAINSRIIKVHSIFIMSSE